MFFINVALSYLCNILLFLLFEYCIRFTFEKHIYFKWLVRTNRFLNSNLVRAQTQKTYFLFQMYDLY